MVQINQGLPWEEHDCPSECECGAIYDGPICPDCPIEPSPPHPLHQPTGRTMTTSYEEARERLAAYGRGERRFDVWSGFDDPHSAILEDLRAFLAGPPDQAKCEHLPDLYACEMGVGCELQGVCFAKANGQPERCAIRPMLSVELRSEEEVVGVLDRLITADIQGPTHGVWDRAYRACVQDAKVNLQALYRSRRNG